LTKIPKAAAGLLEDVRGGVRLVIDGVGGVTGIVESMHRRIARRSPPLGIVADAPTRGITALVYRSIQGTTGLVGKALDAALAGVQLALQASLRDLPPADATPLRDAVVAALNGVVGDHLERTGNPLAVPLELRLRTGLPVPEDPFTAAKTRVLLLIHGLCMNDEQWTRNGHDHGEKLARALGCTAVYVRYNSGRHISATGAELAATLEGFLQQWPVPVERFAIVGHSMGGLVARSAIHQATEAGMDWPNKVRQLVFLGTPHHGAPLERGGNWLHRGLGISPYLAPFTRLSGLRSEGITDLRHGNLLEQEWAGNRFEQRDTRTIVPLPHGVACHAVASTLGPAQRHDGGDRPGAPGRASSARVLSEEWLGDGLVPLASALGRHLKPTRDLHIPPSRIWIGRGINHLDLLSSPAVYEQLRRWLAD
jgi:pimeloyl-ACP methyl ester carboxylesterase